ncbi:hypothetical protein CEXT_619061 [Caerostris extrusa]|uniref:Uncharacterized protein n=1 Tax=Caerostris extrusa TaxID=172846 RepID=A0AAV4T673_CAEEX|nr:hypothetical protein CEXT_619061 [Caerostris extrusa]
MRGVMEEDKWAITAINLVHFLEKCWGHSLQGVTRLSPQMKMQTDAYNAFNSRVYHLQRPTSLKEEIFLFSKILFILYLLQINEPEK